jgi:hypothetical protein
MYQLFALRANSKTLNGSLNRKNKSGALNQNDSRTLSISVYKSINELP